LTVIAVTQGAHGSVTFTAGGVSYTPNANYFGSDSFTYTISDDGTSNAGHTDTATVYVTVTNVNDPPTMTSLSIAPGVINENDSAVLNGSFSDADPGDAHTVVISWGDGSPNSTVNLAAGVFSFTANHQYKDDNPTKYIFRRQYRRGKCLRRRYGRKLRNVRRQRLRGREYYDNGDKCGTYNHNYQRPYDTSTCRQLNYCDGKLHRRWDARHSQVFL
jgi:hypothetical protein